MTERSVILCDVRSAHNVGAIFRTADAAGIAKLYLAGYTPTPIDRFGRENPKLSKTALGAAVTLPWEAVGDAHELVRSLQAAGVQVVAVEQAAHSVGLFSYTPPTEKAVAYVFGNEVTGVPAEISSACDAVVELPMLGHKESLNVAVTVGIVLYHDLFLRSSKD